MLIPPAMAVLDDRCPIGDGVMRPLKAFVPDDANMNRWVDPEEKLVALVRYMLDDDGDYLKILRSMVRVPIRDEEISFF